MTDVDTRDESQRSGTQAVERAIAILGCFQEDDELGVSELAARVGLRVSTAHRIVRALCHEHFLEQDTRTERYRLGRAVAMLGQRAMGHLGFTLARPELDRLSVDTGEASSLGVWQETSVLVVLGAESRQPLRFDHPQGARIPAYASAMGKALLAFSDREDRDLFALLGDMARFTRHTITSKRRLAAELAGIRARGWAVNVEERYAGVVGVAAPVLDEQGRARAAVGVQGPSVRVTQDRLDTLGHRVQEAAQAVATLLPLERV